MRKMMRSCKILMLLKLRLVASIRQKIQKWSLTKWIRSTWSIISPRTKCKTAKRETLMIIKLHKFQNRELIRLLRMQKKLLQNQSLNRLIQVNFNKMSLQLLRKLSLCKMIKLTQWKRSQRKRVHLSLSGNKSKKIAKPKRKCLMHKLKTCHFRHSNTQSNQTMTEPFPSIGLTPTKKTTAPIFSSLVKFGNQKPNPLSPAPSKSKAWKELYSLYQRWRTTKLEAPWVKKRKQLFSRVWLLNSIT